MTRRFSVAVALALLAGVSLLAQTSRSQAVQFKAAQYMEQVDGDLRAAIREYEKVVSGPDRALAAQALLSIADIHQRLGDGQADAVYQRLIRDFPEQTSSVRFARAKRAASRPAPPSAPAAPVAATPSSVPVNTSANRLKDVGVFDRGGRLLLRVSESEPINLVSISPDGGRVAYSPGRRRIVILDVAARTRTEIISDGYSPAGWSPDGSRLTYFKGRSPGRMDEELRIYAGSSHGAGEEELLMRQPNGIYHWTADGRFVIAGTGDSFVAVPVTASDKASVSKVTSIDGGTFEPFLLGVGGRIPIPFLTQVTASGPRISPDSRFVAYTSSGVRESEIMVRPSTLVRGPASPAPGEFKVSSAGALGMARWRGDGGELYYISPDGSVMAVPTSTAGREFWAGTPVRLFRTPPAFPLTNVVGQRADVSSDGERFVLLLAAAD